MSNENIIREIDEELRSDRVRGLWKQFGPYVIGAAIAIVVLVAANEGWAWWQNSNSARSSDQFYAALELADGTDIEAARKALDGVIAAGHGGYPNLARFREASLLAKESKPADAIAAYDRLATTETNKNLRDLALVMAGYLLVDQGDVAAVEQRVGGLVAPNNPMRNAAREALGLAQYKAGNLVAAMQSFEAASQDPLSSQELRNRLQIYLGQLVAEGAALPQEGTDLAEPEPAIDAAPALDVAPAPAN